MEVNKHGKDVYIKLPTAGALLPSGCTAETCRQNCEIYI